ncbi:MAG: peptidylprolyl isomerase, partial [Myxococcota bacterium]
MSHAGRMVRFVGLVLPIAALMTLGDVHEGVAGKATDGSDRVVARVGDAAITVGELERRLASVPPFQLRVYGSNADEIKRNFLERVLIPELLFARGAMQRGKDKDKDFEVRARRRDLLKSALLLDVRDKTLEDAKVSREEIEAYYKQNTQRYQTPARVAVWRILVQTREKAEEIIDQAKNTPTPKAWSELARKHSLDKTTSMRGGNLGFLTKEGISADGKTRVPEALAKAAFGVRDGEIVSEPVPEGSGFAVVWRRG